MAKSKAQADYLEAFNPIGYISNREITNTPGHILVRGSRNMRVSNREKVVSSPGYTLKGAAKTLNKGIKSSYDWYTSSGFYRNLRKYDDELEVWYDSAWIRLKDGWSANKMRFKPWWNSTELIDTLLFVNSSGSIYEWSGLVAKVASVTTNTITKQGYYGASTIAFVEGGASADTLTDSANGFVTAGFAAGDTIVISGSASNNGTFTIATVTAGTITLVAEDDLTTEASGASVVVKWPKGTWSEERAFTSGTRKVVIDAVEYTYTGGETTGTLTGVTPDPSAGGVANDDIALQAIRTYTPATLTNYAADLITVINNHMVYGSSTSHVVYLSKNTDFDDFGYTTPLRIAGEGFLIPLDSAPTSFVVDRKNLYISAGKDDWYEIQFLLSADQAGETIIVTKLDTASGQAAVTQEAVVSIKRNTVFLSFEPTIDTLSRVESVTTEDSVPISHPIKDDLVAYDLTNASGIYWRGNLRYALPNEGLELIYDLENKLWQPPENKPISHHAIIDGVLCGHSSVANETYILDKGRNANGAPISHLAVFGYDNFGTRLSKKVFDEIAAEIYYTPNTIVKDSVYYDYKGSSGIREYTFEEGDEQLTTFAPNDQYGLGQNSFGSQPLGSTGDDVDPINKRKGRYVQGMPPLDFFERQRAMGTDTKDGYLEILAYGENIELSDTLAIFDKA